MALVTGLLWAITSIYHTFAPSLIVRITVPKHNVSLLPASSIKKANIAKMEKITLTKSFHGDTAWSTGLAEVPVWGEALHSWGPLPSHETEDLGASRACPGLAILSTQAVPQCPGLATPSIQAVPQCPGSATLSIPGVPSTHALPVSFPSPSTGGVPMPCLAVLACAVGVCRRHHKHSLLPIREEGTKTELSASQQTLPNSRASSQE